MIIEWLWFWMMFRHAENLCEKFFQQLQIWYFIESCIERQQWPWATQTIARHFQFAHCVDVFNKEFCRRSFWDVWEPHVQILFAPAFEQDGFVAMLHAAHFIHHAQRLRSFHFRFGPMVRHQCTQITHQVTITMIYTTGSKHQNTLLIHPVSLNTIKMKFNQNFRFLHLNKEKFEENTFFSQYSYLVWNWIVRFSGAWQWDLFNFNGLLCCTSLPLLCLNFCHIFFKIQSNQEKKTNVCAHQTVCLMLCLTMYAYFKHMVFDTRHWTHRSGCVQSLKLFIVWTYPLRINDISEQYPINDGKNISAVL